VDSDRSTADLTPNTDNTYAPPVSLASGPSVNAPTFGPAPQNPDLPKSRCLTEGESPALSDYVCVRVLGRGGQGVVWLALRRADQQKVAIKVMHRDWMEDDHARARFEHSYDALLHLDHPGIVRPIDRGMLPTGELWYATEYVSGKDLVQYVESLETGFLAGADTKRARRFPLRPVLELFTRVCDAVEAAHRAGVIHRDLKPSNIVVDSEGRPHIVDFGVAKSQLPRQAALLTMTNEMIGTPSWASPEQVEGNPGAVDTRSDLYSLGVMLYQLVAERFPYEVEGPLPRVFDQIRYAEPKPPRSMVAWVDKDLQSIILKSLRKQPGERYQSIADFRGDIERYLRGEPIIARGDGWTYRAWTTIRRHRLAFSFATAVFALTLIYGIATTVMYRRAQASAADARSKFKIAWNLTELIVSQIDTELSNLPGSTESRRRMLNMAATHLAEFNQEHTDDPELLADLAQANARLADVAGALSEIPQGLQHAEMVLTSRRRLADLRPADPDAKAALSIAIVRVGDFNKGLGNFQRCRASYEEAMAIDEQLAREHPDVPTYSDNLCWSYERNGALARDLADCPRLLDLSDRRLSLARRLVEAEPNVPIRKYNLMSALVERNTAEKTCIQSCDLAACDRRVEEAYAIAKELATAEPHRLQFISALMFRSRDMASLSKDLPTAHERFGEARATARRLMALEPNQPEWRWHLASFDYNESFLLNRAGDRAEAERLIRRAYAEAVTIATTLHYSPSQDSVPLWGGDLCAMLLADGRREEAHDLIANMLQIWRKFFDASEGSPGGLNYISANLLTCSFPDLRDPKAALAYAERAASLSHFKSAVILRTLAEARLANGDIAGCREAIAAARSIMTPSDESLRPVLDEFEWTCTASQASSVRDR